MESPFVKLHQITRTFGVVKALDEVSFNIGREEIVAVVGDNGAGKSTLVKILSGVLRPTSGMFFLNDIPCQFRSPADARNAGIETMFQNLALIDQLDAADNVYLGRETTRGGWIGKWFGLLDRRQMQATTTQMLSELNIHLPSSPVRAMSGGQRQSVALGRAVTWGSQLLILDEPTAALGVAETEQVLQVIEHLRDVRKMSLLIVSHNIQHLYRIADKIVVLRQGKHVITLEKLKTTPAEIVSYIIGAKN